MNIEQTIIQEIEAFHESIIVALTTPRASGNTINTTGEASRSLRINVEKSQSFSKIQSIGIFYLEFLDTGRGHLPQSKPPPIEPLIKWAKKKFGVGDEEAEAIAYAVQKKIAKVGTEIFIRNKEGIELTEKIELLKKVLNEKIAKAAKFEVMQKLDKYKKLYKQKLKLKL